MASPGVGTGVVARPSEHPFCIVTKLLCIVGSPSMRSRPGTKLAGIEFAPVVLQVLEDVNSPRAGTRSGETLLALLAHLCPYVTVVVSRLRVPRVQEGQQPRNGFENWERKKVGWALSRVNPRRQAAHRYFDNRVREVPLGGVSHSGGNKPINRPASSAASKASPMDQASRLITTSPSTARPVFSTVSPISPTAPARRRVIL
jgi:hypothetical protein